MHNKLAQAPKVRAAAPLKPATRVATPVIELRKLAILHNSSEPTCGRNPSLDLALAGTPA
jgi:hypothetical protein